MKNKIINIAAIVLVCFALAAWGLTTVTGQRIINSTIDSTTIGNSSASSGTFTTLSSLWTKLTSAPPTTAPGNTMSLGWNATGAGEGDFVDHYGTGAGAFNWYATDTAAGGGWNPASPIMHLGPAGGLSSAGGYSTSSTVTALGGFVGNMTGNVTGSLNGNAATATALAANPPNCDAWQVASGINASGTPTCGPHIQAATTTSCTTGSATYNTCQVSGTFPHPFPGAYSLSCQMLLASDSRASLGSILTEGTQTFTVSIVTEGSVSVTASAQCIGVSNN